MAPAPADLDERAMQDQLRGLICIADPVIFNRGEANIIRIGVDGLHLVAHTHTGTLSLQKKKKLGVHPCFKDKRGIALGAPLLNLPLV